MKQDRGPALRILLGRIGGLGPTVLAVAVGTVGEAPFAAVGVLGELAGQGLPQGDGERELIAALIGAAGTAGVAMR